MHNVFMDQNWENLLPASYELKYCLLGQGDAIKDKVVNKINHLLRKMSYKYFLRFRIVKWYVYLH